MRPDDIWIDAFGEQKGLIRSYLGPAAAHPGKKGTTPSIFREVMKTHGEYITLTDLSIIDMDEYLDLISLGAYIKESPTPYYGKPKTIS